jgi:hypothetical protein
MSAVTARSFARPCLAVALALAASCGSDTKMPPMGPSGGSIATLFAVFPETVRLGPGDRGWLFAQAAAVPSDPKDVTASTRWESSNPSVASVQGNIITAILPGDVQVRGAFQTFVAATHVTVFSPASVREFTMPKELVCWPAETFSWTAQAVLDSGDIVLPSSITWRSLDDTIAAIAPVEVQNSTGTIGMDARVTCRAAGTTRFEATYAGHTAVAQVTVRAPRDVIEVRGASATPSPTAVHKGVDVFYVLDSEPSARIDVRRQVWLH